MFILKINSTGNIRNFLEHKANRHLFFSPNKILLIGTGYLYGTHRHTTIHKLFFCLNLEKKSISWGMLFRRYGRKTFWKKVSNSFMLNHPDLLAVKTLPTGPLLTQSSYMFPLGDLYTVIGGSRLPLIQMLIILFKLVMQIRIQTSTVQKGP